MLGKLIVLAWITSAIGDNSANSYEHMKHLKEGGNVTDATREVISQIIYKKCSHQYSIICLKLDISRLLDKLSSSKNLAVLPGISIVHTENITNSSSIDIPTDVAISIIKSNNTNNVLNSYLLKKLGTYLGSLSVRVNLLENPIVRNLKEVSYRAFTSIVSPFDVITGRSKKQKHDMHAAVWSAAMLAALGFAGLAALAGKAMLTGTLALILSLLCLLKGCGNSGKSSHYEIITKPGHLHDVEHIGYTAALGSAPYNSYARHLIQDRVIPSLSIIDEGSEEKDVETKVIPVHAYQISPNYVPTSTYVHR